MSVLTETTQRLIDQSIDATPSVTKLQALKRKARQLMMLPTYSKQSDVYQMDTFEQSDAIKEANLEVTGRSTRSNAREERAALQEYVSKRYPPYFLILINVNTRKGYAYPMNSKSEESVINVLEDFYYDVKREKHTIWELYSDDDAAYRGDKINQWYENNRIKHVHTTNQNKHTLGIINRFIRTLRDMAGNRRNISVSMMNTLISRYNQQKHRSTHRKPNEMTSSEEKEWIMDNYQKEQAIKAATMLDSGTRVRRQLDRVLFEKRRLEYDPISYPIDSLKGKVYRIKYKNSLINVPRWKLRTEEGIEHIDKEPERIIDFNEEWNMYQVEYADGTTGYVSFDNLRDDRYELHPLEKRYWRGTKRDDTPMSVRLLLNKDHDTKKPTVIRLRVKR